jgi:hypothetical protein
VVKGTYSAQVVVPDEAAGRFRADYTGTSAGHSVGGGRDLTSDGLVDLIVGAPASGAAFDGAGAVYILSWFASGDLTPGDAEAVINGESANASAGSGVLLHPDLDGDGVANLEVGSIDLALKETLGAVYVIWGPVSGDIGLSDADYRLLPHK